MVLRRCMVSLGRDKGSASVCAKGDYSEPVQKPQRLFKVVERSCEPQLEHARTHSTLLSYA